MSYNDEVFISQYPLAFKFLQHAVYYEVLIKGYNDAEVVCSFWTATIDAHYCRAAMNWCMVFGSDSCNDTHWKQLAGEQAEHVKDSFRAELLHTCNLTYKQWHEYWDSMVSFRNNYIAHRSLEFSQAVPSLKTAIKVTLFYDQWIRNLIAPHVFDQQSLNEWERRFRAEAHSASSQFFVQPVPEST